MKSLWLIVSLSLIFISCGKNAFLDTGVNFISTVEGDNDLTYGVEISNRSINIGNVSSSDNIVSSLFLKNVGDLKIEKILVESKKNFLKFDTSACDNLAILKSCRITVKYDLREQEGSIDESVDVFVALSNSEKYKVKDFKIQGFVQDPSILDGPLVASFLKNKTVKFKGIYLGSTYKKLIYLDSLKGDIQIQRFSSHNTEGLNLNFFNGELKCSRTEVKNCFIELSLTPTKLGDLKEKVSITYIDKSTNSKYRLKLKVTARVIKIESCYDFKEIAHVAKRKESYNQYESSLAYPYYNRVPGTFRTLSGIFNTEYTKELNIYDEIIYYNQDSQVVFSYDFIRADKKESISSLKLLLDILKFEDIKNESKDTEILCNLDYKVCSGKRFRNSEYRALINKDFSLVNNKFSKKIMFRGNKSNFKFFKAKESFNLMSYLNLKEDSLEKLSDENQTISFSVADDIKLEESPIMVSTRRVRRACAN